MTNQNWNDRNEVRDDEAVDNLAPGRQCRLEDSIDAEATEAEAFEASVSEVESPASTPPLLDERKAFDFGALRGKFSGFGRGLLNKANTACVEIKEQHGHIGTPIGLAGSLAVGFAAAPLAAPAALALGLGVGAVYVGGFIGGVRAMERQIKKSPAKVIGHYLGEEAAKQLDLEGKSAVEVLRALEAKAAASPQEA